MSLSSLTDEQTKTHKMKGILKDKTLSMSVFIFVLSIISIINSFSRRPVSIIISCGFNCISITSIGCIG